MIVCGWYTEDYAHWVPPLVASLEKFGHEHDFVEVPKASGGWERNTLRKPGQIIASLRRHRSETIVFLDVDCEVMAPLDEIDSVSGDIAAHLVVGSRSRGYGRMFARSGTMVVRQTSAAKAFLRDWAYLSEMATVGQVDQHTLTEAITLTPGLTVTNLGVEYCAMAKDGVRSPIILHSGASRGAIKVSGWRRSLNAMMGIRQHGVAA